MAVVSNPLIGKAKQSMGGATFSSWKGIQVLKNKATTVGNPRTGKQLQQRSAMRQIVAIFRQWPGAIKAGYKKEAVKKSEYNAFVADALDAAFDMSTPPDAIVNPNKLHISKGTIAATIITAATASAGAATVTITFPTTATQPGQSISDLAVVGAYDSATDTASGILSSALRSAGTVTFPAPSGMASGDQVNVYLGFSNELTGESSTSDNLVITAGA